MKTLGAALVAALVFSMNPAPAQGQLSAGYALTFDGVDDLAIVPNNPLLELADGTLELWFKPDWAPGSIAYDPVLVANNLDAALTRYSLRVSRDLSGVALANGTSVSTVPHTFTRGEWYHLALVDTGSTAQVYVNGQFVGSTGNGFGTLIGLPFHIGSDAVAGFFRGQMDEVRIWSVPRAAAEIRRSLPRALTGDEAGLVAYWRMEEGLGSSAADATTNRLDGALAGAAWAASGVNLINTSGSLHTALDLTASRDTCVQVASAPSLALTNQFTFEAWIYPRTAQCGTILSRGDGANLTTTDYLFQVGTDGTNCGVMKLGLLVAGQWAISESAVSLNAWTHVAASFDGVNAQFYIDGVLDRTVATGGSVYQSGSPLYIGRKGSVGGDYFDGMLDEVRVWSVARTAGEIRANVNRVPPASTPGLVGYWRFDEQAGIRAFDSSGLGNHGTILNRPVRAPSFRAPVVTVSGADPLRQECHAAFADPGAAGSQALVAVAAGPVHSLALRNDGSVRGWGFDQDGQIDIPPGATNVVAIAAGSYHGVALKADGSVIGWGRQYGLPVGATNVVAIASGLSHVLALNPDGTVLAWGANDYGQTNVPPAATNIAAIAAGGATSLALRNDGTVIAWGANGHGQTNIPASATAVVSVAVGFSHCLAVKANGTVVGWGNSFLGEISIPTSAYNIVAVAASEEHSLALRADGVVIAWGNSNYGLRNIPVAATNIAAIGAGVGHSLAVRGDGSVFAWGRNDEGQITVPSDVNRLEPGVIVRGSVSPDVPGTYVLTYTATNNDGAVATATRTVIVTDTTPPVLTLIGGNPWNLDVGTPFVDPGATASDACAGDLTGSIVRAGTVDPALPGAYTLAYTVTDASGNTAATNRTVLVRGWPAVLGFTAFFSGTNAVTGSPVVQFLADVNPNGLPTLAFAEYGLNTAYPGRTDSVSLPAGYNTSTFFATLDGLIPGVTYHFRVAASNSLGAVYGPDQTFTVPLLFAAGDLNGDGQVDQAELDTVVSNHWSSSSGLWMTNPVNLGYGRFQFTLGNAGGPSFSVLGSTNLTTWDLLGSTYPVYQFLDPAGTNWPYRFYRLRWP